MLTFPAVLPCITILTDAAALTTLSPATAVPRAHLNGAVRSSKALHAYTLASAAQFPGSTAPRAGAGGRFFLPTIFAAIAHVAHAYSLHTAPAAPAIRRAGAGSAGGAGVA